MSEILAEARRKRLDTSFESRRLILEDAARIIGPVGTLLDVGCDDGYFDLKVAQVFKPNKIILTDIDESLQVPLPPNAQFRKVDVCTHEFLTMFQNQVTLVICSQTLHETGDIFKAVQNLLTVLPIGGTTLIFDYAEEGLQVSFSQAKKEGGKDFDHFVQDLRNLVRFGLETDKGIKEFWEEKVFPNTPGLTHLFFHGMMYSVVYVAKEWGEIKQPPPAIEPELRRLGYIK